MKRNFVIGILLCLLLPLQLLAVEGVADTSKVKKRGFWDNKEIGITGGLGLGFIIADKYKFGNIYNQELYPSLLWLRSFNVFLRSSISEHWNLRVSFVNDYYSTKYEEVLYATRNANFGTYLKSSGTFSTITLNPGIGFENCFAVFDQGAGLYFIYGLEFPIHLLATKSNIGWEGYSRDYKVNYTLYNGSVASIGGVINLGFGSYIPISNKLKLNLEIGLKQDFLSRWKSISFIDKSAAFSNYGYYLTGYLSAGFSYKLGKPMPRSKVDPKIYYYRDNSKGVYEYRKAKPVTPSPVFGEDNIADGKFDTLSLPEVKKIKSTAKREAKIAAVIEGTVAILRPDQGHGSGFLISEDGYLVTNAHVVDTFKTVKIKLSNNLVLSGKVVRKSTKHDLALVKIDGEGFKPLHLGSADSVGIGADVFIIGSPFDTQLSSTVTKGILSSKRTYNEIKLIQTDAAINGGNSGGPLINENGEVIGIAFSKIKMTGVEGLGFCVAADEVKEALKVVQGKK